MLEVSGFGDRRDQVAHLLGDQVSDEQDEYADQQTWQVAQQPQDPIGERVEPHLLGGGTHRIGEYQPEGQIAGQVGDRPARLRHLLPRPAVHDRENGVESLAEAHDHPAHEKCGEPAEYQQRNAAEKVRQKRLQCKRQLVDQLIQPEAGVVDQVYADLLQRRRRGCRRRGRAGQGGGGLVHLAIALILRRSLQRNIAEIGLPTAAGAPVPMGAVHLPC